MGGRVAEEVIFGHDKVSSGASGDIQYATKLARDMVTQWGMSDELGPLQYEEPQGETFLGYSQSARVHMSDETAKKIDMEIRKTVETGYDRASKVLSDHVDQLHLLANALLEYETLSGDEIKTLLDKGEIVREGTVIKPASVPAAGSSIPKTRKGGSLGGAAPMGPDTSGLVQAQELTKGPAAHMRGRAFC
jgi:cell division protease FtsH